MIKGSKHSPQARAKMSAAAKGNKRALGRRHTLETCTRMSIAHKGKRLSPEHRAGISAATKGFNNPNWHGGITSERQRARDKPEYVAWRDTVFARDDFTCQVCSKRGGALEAHHIIPWAVCRALVYDVPNGLTTCKAPCHRKVLHAPSMRLAG